MTITKDVKKNKHGILFNLYTGEGGIDFIKRRRLWYWITAVLVVLSIAFILLRGFALSIEFKGGTKLSMPAADLSVSKVEETFVDATGIKPELVQIVGSGDSRVLEINSAKLTDDQVQTARKELFDTYQPKNVRGEVSSDAIGNSTVSESWGSSITKRMVIALGVFLLVAFIYIGIRLEREMALAAMAALILDGVVLAGIYAATGFEVSPATVIGFLTVLTFSIYDTVVVFDKVRENTANFATQNRRLYSEQANLAVNQTFMRSISTTVISALPIASLMIVAVWMMGVGTLKDLALIQFIGVVEGAFSSVFLATPLLVSLKHRTAKVRKHNKEVLALREGVPTELVDETPAGSDNKKETSSIKPVGGSPIQAPRGPAGGTGSTWRP